MLTLGTAVVRPVDVGAAWRGAMALGKTQILKPPREDSVFVELVDEKGHPAGAALYAPEHDLPYRLLASSSVLDPISLLRTRLERAIRRRSVDVGHPEICRLVNGAADGIPLLFVDRIGLALVIRATSSSSAKVARALYLDLMALTGAPIAVLWTSTNGTWVADVLAGTDTKVSFSVEGVQFVRDVSRATHVGEMTGTAGAQVFLRRWARGRALDFGTRDGAFGIHLAYAGATSTTIVGADAALRETIDRDRKVNEVADRTTVVDESAEAFLDRCMKDREKFDVVVGHAPGDVASRSSADVMQSAYSLLKLVDPGAILLLFPTAHGVTGQDFEDAVADAALRLKRQLQILRRLSPGPDHAAVYGMTTVSPHQTIVLRVHALN